MTAHVSGRVCILGGSGFIGQATTDALHSRNQAIRVVSRHAARPADCGDTIEWRCADYASVDDLALAMQGADTVVNLAGSATPARAEVDRVSEFMELQTVQNILDAAQRSGVRHLVHVSSGGTVYGEAQQALISEDHATRPLSVHGVIKLAAEGLVSAFARNHGMQATVLRVANAYGSRQNTTRGQGLVGVLLRAVRSGETIAIFGDGSAVRDYVHVDDVADAIIAALDAGAASGLYNVGTGSGHSVREVITMTETLAGRTINIEWRPARGSDVLRNVLDVSRIRETLGWSPRRNFADGLRQMLDQSPAA